MLPQFSGHSASDWHGLCCEKKGAFAFAFMFDRLYMSFTGKVLNYKALDAFMHFLSSRGILKVHGKMLPSDDKFSGNLTNGGHVARSCLGSRERAELAR